MEWLRMLFGFSAEESIRNTVSELLSVELPSLDEAGFQSAYAKAWAIALLIAIVTTLLKLAKALGSHGRPEDMRDGATVFLKVLIVGLLLPPAIMLGQQIGVIFGEAAFTTLDINPDEEWYESLSAFGGGADQVGNLIANVFASLSTFLLSMEAALVARLIYIGGIGGIIAFALKDTGRFGQTLWSWMVGYTLVGIAALPFMIIVLAFGAWMASQSPTDGSFLNLAVMACAALVPLMVFIIYLRKYTHITGGNVGVHGDVNTSGADSDDGPGLIAKGAGMTAATLGLVYAYREGQDSMLEEGSGSSEAAEQRSTTTSVRRFVNMGASAGATKALATSHPVIGATAMTVAHATREKPVVQKPKSTSASPPSSSQAPRPPVSPPVARPPVVHDRDTRE